MKQISQFIKYNVRGCESPARSITPHLKLERHGQVLFFALFVFFILICIPRPSLGGIIELSQQFSYERSNYSKTDYNWKRKWTTGIGYHFSDVSGLEFAFEDAVTRTHIQNYQNTTYHDRTYSLSWLQALFPKTYMFQPFFRAGVGQLNRQASGTFAGGYTPPPRVDAVTVVLGAGFRLYFTQQFALRAQATSYLEGGSIGTWKDNISLSAGLSVFF